MIGVRLNSFNDNSNEPEQDASSALTELDKGVRSTKVGEQCEAIVRFPRLFEKYPFPILINSSFLKLADVFRTGNNFLRLWVLRVCQQSEKHLDKILNVDEFLRRIFSVLHSNDPVARALSLRTLGAVAGIIPERQNVHHAIRRGLDSHDSVEVDAAIYATTRFAAHSNAFAVAMCNKLSDMVECESTGAERRAKLVRALRTVHGGAVRAQGVLKLLRSLLERFPSSSSVRAAITALTAIAADTVVHVPDQVELLLNIARQDARAAVRRAALAGLRRLARHAALWPARCIDALVAAAAGAGDAHHAALCLEVMAILVRCPAVCAAAGGPSALRRHCAAAALGAELRHAALACAVLTAVMVHCYKEHLPVEGSEFMLALESLVVASGLPGGEGDVKPLRIALRCLVQLSAAEPASYAARTASVVGAQLRRAVGARERALLEALGALGGGGGAACAWGGGGAACAWAGGAALPALRDKLSAAAAGAGVSAGAGDDDGTALVLLCTLVFQERAAAALGRRLRAEWAARVLAAAARADGWTRYRVARAALRYGHHGVAAELLARLAADAPSEAAQRWLGVLHRAAVADATLAEQGISYLEECSGRWEVCGGWGGAGAAGGGLCAAGCAGCGACQPLPPAWMRARAAALAALARTAAAARALCTQPPPARAHAIAQATRDPAAKAGACAGALRRAARALAAAAQRYACIARTAFHADDATLRHLYISQHTYSQLAQLVERAACGQPGAVSVAVGAVGAGGGEPSPSTLEERAALAPSEALTAIAAKLFDNPSVAPGLSHRHAEGVLAAVRACCVGALWPRGAFSGLAGAGVGAGVGAGGGVNAAVGAGAGGACRLSLTPAWRAPAECAALLPLTHHLALKVEGVILPPPKLTKHQKQRQVKAVQLTVTATPHPRTNDKSVELTHVPPVLTAVQTVPPVRDYFSGQQLVAVGAPGAYTVAVEAALVDQAGRLWHTGPRVSIVIKAHDDSTTKVNPQNSRGRF